VVAYNPNSKYASQFKRSPMAVSRSDLFTLMERPASNWAARSG
jgi:hypothetical protein